jgi:hypothetical protein
MHMNDSAPGDARDDDAFGRSEKKKDPRERRLDKKRGEGEVAETMRRRRANGNGVTSLQGDVAQPSQTKVEEGEGVPGLRPERPGEPSRAKECGWSINREGEGEEKRRGPSTHLSREYCVQTVAVGWDGS